MPRVWVAQRAVLRAWVELRAARLSLRAGRPCHRSPQRALTLLPPLPLPPLLLLSPPPPPPLLLLLLLLPQLLPLLRLLPLLLPSRRGR